MKYKCKLLNKVDHRIDTFIVTCVEPGDLKEELRVTLCDETDLGPRAYSLISVEEVI